MIPPTRRRRFRKKSFSSSSSSSSFSSLPSRFPLRLRFLVGAHVVLRDDALHDRPRADDHRPVLVVEGVPARHRRGDLILHRVHQQRVQRRVRTVAAASFARASSFDRPPRGGSIRDVFRVFPPPRVPERGAAPRGRRRGEERPERDARGVLPRRFSPRGGRRRSRGGVVSGVGGSALERVARERRRPRGGGLVRVRGFEVRAADGGALRGPLEFRRGVKDERATRSALGGFELLGQARGFGVGLRAFASRVLERGVEVPRLGLERLLGLPALVDLRSLRGGHGARHLERPLERLLGCRRSRPDQRELVRVRLGRVAEVRLEHELVRAETHRDLALGRELGLERRDRARVVVASLERNNDGGGRFGRGRGRAGRRRRGVRHGEERRDAREKRGRTPAGGERAAGEGAVSAGEGPRREPARGNAAARRGMMHHEYKHFIAVRLPSGPRRSEREFHHTLAIRRRCRDCISSSRTPL